MPEAPDTRPSAAVPPYQNRYPHGEPTFRDYVRWNWERLRYRRPPPPKTPIRGVAPDLAFIHGNRGETAVTWIGHSTLLLQVGGVNILTDPHFSRRASPVQCLGPKRHQPPGLALNDLPHIHAVALSHTHYDHLDKGSVRRLYRQAGGPPTFFLPLGVDQWFVRHVTDGDATHLVTLGWWEGARFGDFTFHCCPVQHWSGRTLFDRNRTLWCGWAILHPAFSFFFSGDLGYSKDTADIGERFGGFDLAAIAVGAYAPRYFMQNQHIDAAEAVAVHRDLRARRSVGIHWGTFERLTDEPLDQPPEDLARARQAQGLGEEDFFLLRHGETWRPDRPLPGSQAQTGWAARP